MLIPPKEAYELLAEILSDGAPPAQTLGTMHAFMLDVLVSAGYGKTVELYRCAADTLGRQLP